MQRGKRKRLHVLRRSDLETHGVFVKIARLFAVPILNAIPSSVLQGAVRKFSPFGSKVIARPGTTHALEALYGEKRKPRGGFISRVADRFWNTVISQPKAVRNRLRIVESELEKEIVRALETKREIDVVNIGGGSSRAFIEIVSRLSKDRTFTIRITTIDKDPRAIELGKEIAAQYGVGDVFTWVQADARSLGTLVPADAFDIAEMVGLLDYFDREQSIALIAQVYRALRPGGMFIVANVYPNREMQFVRKVGWPAMYYKTEEHLFDILAGAGFSEDFAAVFAEPLKVHIIGIARK